MMGYKFGKSSVKNIQTVNPILQELAARAIELSKVDFGVISNGGLRTAEEQNELFKKDRSKLDGFKKKSYHQSGLAIDFVPYVDGGYTWSNKWAFLEITKSVFEAWEDLPHQDYYLHWGGYWSAKDLNMNGVLDIEDKLGWDLPHFELRTKPQIKGVYPFE